MGTLMHKKSVLPQDTFYRLVIDCSKDSNPLAVSINRQLALELSKLRPRMRSLQMEKCLLNVLNSLGNSPLIKGIDVMFNPAYSIDVMNVLISTYKQKPFRLIWPGTCKDNSLVYSEYGFEDYKVYDIDAYDIVCLE